ncbi:unnamed protein product, partial [marine sediment metagenome]
MPISNPLGAPLQSQGKAETRVLTVASGDVAYTGYGFRPTALLIFAADTATGAASWGVASSDKTYGLTRQLFDDNMSHGTFIVYLAISSGNSQSAILKSFDADGFTLTWSKTGTPSGTAY